jgi:hypothetical protein
MKRISSCAASALCLGVSVASLAGAQQIRRVADPGQSVRLPHGSYVCDGQINTSPVDETYDMVTCTGPIYNSADYAALYTKLTHDELVKLNTNTQRAINRDIKAAIHRQIQGLPANMRQTAAIQNLEKSLADYVDQRLPDGRNDDPSR